MSAQISSAQSKAVGPNKKGDSDGYNICYIPAIFRSSQKQQYDFHIFTHFPSLMWLSQIT